MGLNSVAVLLNDFCGEIEREGGELGKRMSFAMQNYNDPRHKGYFHVGRVISCAHSIAHQIVIVHGNTGQSIHDANDLSYTALAAMADCLKRHGWHAMPPKKPRKSRSGSNADADARGLGGDAGTTPVASPKEELKP